MGLKIIDGTPTEISKFLRERKMKKQTKEIKEASEEFKLDKKIKEFDDTLCYYPEGSLDVRDVKHFITLIESKVLMDWKGQNEFIEWLKNKSGRKLI